MVFAIGKTKHPVDLFLGVRFLVLHVLANCQVGLELEPLWSKDVQTLLPPSESPTSRKIFTSNISDSCLFFSPAGPNDGHNDNDGHDDKDGHNDNDSDDDDYDHDNDYHYHDQS